MKAVVVVVVVVMMRRIRRMGLMKKWRQLGAIKWQGEQQQQLGLMVVVVVVVWLFCCGKGLRWGKEM